MREPLPPVLPILVELLEIPSPTGHEGPICDRVEARVEAAAAAGQPLRWRRDGDGLVVRGPRRAGRPLLMLVGHLDTVPAPDSLRPARAGGRVVGRGAVDMKAGLAVMLGLLEGLDLERSRWDLAWVFYPGEEGGYAANGLGDLLADGRLPAADEVDLAVVLEPTAGELQLGCVGSVSADVIFAGVAAHAARPWLGRNAITRAGAWLARMEQRGTDDVEVAGFPYRETYQVVLAEGGVAQNVVPDRFVCRVNHRFAPGKTVAEAIEELRAVCEARAGEGEVDGTDAAPAASEPPRFRVVDACPAAPPAVDNPLVAALRDGLALPVLAKQAWTDVGRLADAGYDAINFGPGDPTRSHQDDEWIAEDELNPFYRELTRFLLAEDESP